MLFVNFSAISFCPSDHASPWTCWGCTGKWGMETGHRKRKFFIMPLVCDILYKYKLVSVRIVKPWDVITIRRQQKETDYKRSYTTNLHCTTCNWFCILYCVVDFSFLIENNTKLFIVLFFSICFFFHKNWVPCSFQSFPTIHLGKAFFGVWKNQQYIVNWVNLCMGLYVYSDRKGEISIFMETLHSLFIVARAKASQF